MGPLIVGSTRRRRNLPTVVTNPDVHGHHLEVFGGGGGRGGRNVTIHQLKIQKQSLYTAQGDVMETIIMGWNDILETDTQYRN